MMKPHKIFQFGATCAGCTGYHTLLCLLRSPSTVAALRVLFSTQVRRLERGYVSATEKAPLSEIPTMFGEGRGACESEADFRPVFVFYRVR